MIQVPQKSTFSALHIKKLSNMAKILGEKILAQVALPGTQVSEIAISHHYYSQVSAHLYMKQDYRNL